MPRSSRTIRLMLPAVAVTLLAACSEVPTSGPIVAGNPVRAQDPLPYVAFGAAEPLPGDDPAGIVDGFIDAMSAYQPGYETAGLFLTPEALAGWEPGAGITVHRGVRPGIELVDDDLVQVTLSVSGEVHADGSFTAVEPKESRTIDLTMAEVDGEWRIDEPPEGTIISEDNFAREYESHRLCFFDPGLTMFAYDPVYVPKNGQTPTLLAQMLLDGPSDWLDPAVRTAFPEQVTLSVPSVPVESGVATVDLSSDAQETDPPDRSRMAAQLACTLSGLSEVNRVAINAEGIVMVAQDDAVPAEVVDRYDPDAPITGSVLHAVVDGAMVRDDGDGLQPVPGALGVVADVSEIALRGDDVAVVAAAGQQLQLASVGGEVRQTLGAGVSLTSPTWGPGDVVWAVDQGVGNGELVAVRTDGSQLEVRAPELEELAMTQAAVSPDGTRMAVVADGVAYLAIIVFDGDDSGQVSVERLHRIGPEGTALDVAWAASDRVALLTDLPTRGHEVLILDAFGAVQSSRGTVPGAERLAAGPDQRLVVGTADGALLEHESRTRWVDRGAGTAPAYP